MSTISCYFRSSWWFTVCRKRPACRCTKETMHTVNGMLSFVTADSEICTSCELVSHWNLSQTNGNYFTFSIQLSPARSRLTVQRTPFNMSLTHLQRQVWNIWSALDARSQVWTNPSCQASQVVDWTEKQKCAMSQGRGLVPDRQESTDQKGCHQIKHCNVVYPTASR